MTKKFFQGDAATLLFMPNQKKKSLYTIHPVFAIDSSQSTELKHLYFLVFAMIVNRRNELHKAAGRGHDKKIEELIQRGVSLDERTSHNETALYLAVENENNDAVKLLVEAGADKVMPLNSVSLLLILFF